MVRPPILTVLRECGMKEHNPQLCFVPVVERVTFLRATFHPLNTRKPHGNVSESSQIKEMIAVYPPKAAVAQSRARPVNNEQTNET